MKKKERREVKELIDLLIRCDKTLTYLAENGKWLEGYSTLFNDLEKFGITDLWYGVRHNQNVMKMIKNFNSQKETNNEKN